MKNRLHFRIFGYLFFALIMGLVARTFVAGNDQKGFGQFRHFLGTSGSIGEHSLSTQPAQPHVHIIEATYGDKSTGNTCIPNLSICKETTECELTVNDSLCDTDAAVKVLEVVWDCGAGTEFKTSTAAKGTKITLSCGN